MATGDSRLSNTARLLAAQEINRRALEKKAQEKLAKIEAERQKELAKTTRRKQQQLAQARNAVERQRIQDDINRQLASKKEQERQAKINAEAQAKAKKAIQKVVGKGNIETLSGRVAIKNDSGKIIGLSNQESKSSLRAKSLIKQEIQRREEQRTKVTDLERFLSNEQALAQGKISRSELLKQIAERKKRGLSKTPQQKLALERSNAGISQSRLKSRQAGKPQGIIGATFGETQAEAQKSLGRSQNFTNLGFISGGGRSFQARGKDDSLGQITSQLAVLQKARTKKSTRSIQNEQVASQIASGNFFGNLSNAQLLNITGGGTSGRAQSAKQQKSGVKSNTRFSAKKSQQSSPFSIIAQQDIPDPVTGITDREVQAFRKELKRKGQPVPPTSAFFTGGRVPRSNDPFSGIGNFGNFGGRDTTKLRERPNVGLGSSIFSDTQTQADIDRTRKEVARQGAGFGSSNTSKGAKQQLAKSKSKRKAGDFGTFNIVGTEIVGKIPSPLKQSETRQFGSLNLPPAESQRQADLGIPFIVPVAFGDTGSQSKQTKSKSKSTKSKKQKRSFGGFDFGNFDFGQESETVKGESGIDNIFNIGNEKGFQLPTISQAITGQGLANPFQPVKGVSQSSLNREILKNLQLGA